MKKIELTLSWFFIVMHIFLVSIFGNIKFNGPNRLKCIKYNKSVQWWGK